MTPTITAFESSPDRGMAMLLEQDKSWYAARLPVLEDRVRVRQAETSSHLGNADWLNGAVSAGDLTLVATPMPPVPCAL